MKAFEMYKLSILMRDSISNKETQHAVVQQQALYENEKNKAIDDAEHDKVLAIEQEKKAKQEVIIFSIAAGLCLVAIFLVFMLSRLKVTRKQKYIIEQQKVKVEQVFIGF